MGAAAGEGPLRDVRGGRAEQPASVDDPLLVGVEGRGHGDVARLRGLEADLADDAERQQRRAAGADARGGDGLDLLGGEHVEQGGRGDEVGGSRGRRGRRR